MPVTPAEVGAETGVASAPQTQAPAEDPTLLRVSLEVFAGPLDLLLHLVRERQLDIATVPLATVAQQYFDYVAVMKSVDVETAAEYLVIAATLAYLKSKSLLPPIPAAFMPEGEESPELVEERLRSRLIAYSTYKDAAESLRERRELALAHHFREGGDPTSAFSQRFRLKPERLAKALMTAVTEAKPDKRTIVRERFSIGRQMEFVFRTVRERGAVEFVALCRDFDRSGVIATFLAILELVRQRRLAYVQSTPDDPLRLLPFAQADVRAN